MKFSATAVLSVAALPALAAAHKGHLDARHHHNARQVPAAAAVSTPAASASAPLSASAPAASSPAASAAPSSASGGIGPSVSLLSTNPTALPLSSIVGGAPSQPTHPLPSSPVAGAQPTFIPAAPPLPNGVFSNISRFQPPLLNSLFLVAQINPANYPALDKPPPTDSPQVKQWIQEVQSSGVTIPNISPTVVLLNILFLLQAFLRHFHRQVVALQTYRLWPTMQIGVGGPVVGVHATVCIAQSTRWISILTIFLI
jgi:hypothetical protein